MSQADMNAVASSESGLSLATITAGVLAAVFFLLISSYVSNDISWHITSDRAWNSTGLTGHDLSGNVDVAETPAPASKVHSIKLPSDETAHFSDALYSADFMNAMTEPT